MSSYVLILPDFLYYSSGSRPSLVCVGSLVVESLPVSTSFNTTNKSAGSGLRRLALAHSRRNDCARRRNCGTGSCRAEAWAWRQRPSRAVNTSLQCSPKIHHSLLTLYSSSPSAVFSCSGEPTWLLQRSTRFGRACKSMLYPNPREHSMPPAASFPGASNTPTLHYRRHGARWKRDHLVAHKDEGEHRALVPRQPSLKRKKT